MHELYFRERGENSVSTPIKGSLVVAQAGGPTVVINRTLQGLVEQAQKYPQIEHIYGAIHGLPGIKDEKLIDLRAEKPETLHLVWKTPSAALLSSRYKPDLQKKPEQTMEELNAVFRVLQERNIRYFFYIGGNDSANVASILNSIARKRDYQLRCFHIPKTIDNDLLENDHCPGYGSAARYVALSFMGDNLDTRALPGVKINVCMGRNAGWLTAASALARQRPGEGPHLIYVPERPKKLVEIVEDIDRIYDARGRVVVAVAEGLRALRHESEKAPLEFLESQSIIEELQSLGMHALLKSIEALREIEKASGGNSLDPHGNPQLSGSGALADFLAAALKIYRYKKHNKKIRVRSETLGYNQRAFPGVISEVDLKEARKVGVAAMREAMKANVDGSIVIKRVSKDPGSYKIRIRRVALHKVSDPNKSSSNQIQVLPPSMIAKAGNDVTQEFIDYARPLVGKLPKMGHLEQLLEMEP
jgi:6-phosphofructokinase